MEPLKHLYREGALYKAFDSAIEKFTASEDLDADMAATARSLYDEESC